MLVLGRDELGVVYRLREKSTGLVLLGRRREAKRRRAAARELSHWNPLDHPTVPVLYDALVDVDDDGASWIIFQNSSGGMLLERATAEDTLSEDKVALFIRQLLEALQHLHSKNTLHLDVKPENVMLSESGKDEIRLIDFGLSRKLSRTGDTYGTMGTPEFVPPEIVNVAPVGFKSDVWSVGVLAYVMLSGMSPFLGDSDEETIARVAEAKWSFDPKAFANVSHDAQDFISRILKLNTFDRLSVEAALIHPWLNKPNPSPAKLTTSLLKEFKYRHQWVERRIFTQSGPDDDNVQVKSPRNTLEWMEPLYFPPPLNQHQRHSPTSPGNVAQGTFTLPPVQSDQSSPKKKDNPLDGQKSPKSPAGPESPQARRQPTSQTSAGPGGDDIQGGGEGPFEDLDPTDASLFTLIQGEYRPIEEEIANRILSDISEEGSVASTEDLEGRDKESKKGKSSSRRQREREARMRALDEQLERDRTPTRESVEAAEGGRPTSTDSARGDDEERPAGVKRTPSGRLVDAVTGAPVVVKGLRPITLEVDDRATQSPSPTRSTASPSFSPGPGGCGKSPVRLSPTKEHVMEIVIDLAKRQSEESEGPGDAQADGLDSGRKKGKTDGELERLMGEVEAMKANLHQRRKDILSGNVPRDPRRPPEDGYPVPGRPEVEYEDYEWDSTYQTGPETYLLALRDPGLTARIRDYRRELIGDSATRCQSGVIGERNLDITVRERRRYSDMMREDVGVQKSVSFMDQGMKGTRLGTVRRVRSDHHVPPPPPATCFSNHHGGKPMFQVRPKDGSFLDEGRITLSCVVVGSPKPALTWFHNESPIIAGKRVTMTEEGGRSTLSIFPAYSTDVGVYSVSASSEAGSASAHATVRMGDLPEKPSRPSVELASDSEVFMTWEPPSSPFAHMDILGYRLEIRRAGEEEWAGDWSALSDELDEEAAVVRGLDPLGIYQFRLRARNAFGLGEPSLSSRIVRTHPKGAPKLNLDILKQEVALNLVTFHKSQPRQNGAALSGIAEEAEEEEGTPTPEARPTSLDLNTSDAPEGRFQLESLLFKGRMSLVRNAVDKANEATGHCVAKVLVASPDRREDATAEFEALRAAQHDHVPTLLAAYLRNDFLLLFQERMYETLTERFTRHDSYNEDQIARSLQQLVVALDWLHFKGIVHLDIQPENLMFTGKRTWHLKLIDFGSAVTLSPDTVTVPRRVPNPLFSAPEILQGGSASTLSDMWNVGVVLYVLLSGFHPWETDSEVVRTADEAKRAVLEERLDLNFVFTNATQEALRFLTWALCKEPGRRMRESEALEHRWLAPQDAMRRRREHCRYSANRLRSWAREEAKRRAARASTNNQLLSTYDP